MKIYFLMLGLIITGTMATLFTKALDLHNVKGLAFDHPYFQSGIMFFGELLCLIPYFIITRQEKTEAGFWQYSLPAGCDLLATTMSNIGLILTSASVYQMLKGGIVIVVALMSVTLLRRKLSMQQLGGVLLVFTGVSLVGFSSIAEAG
jgi:drug/metabolite transporter (DMT)-like permease